HPLRTNPKRAQLMRQLVGATLKLPVAELLIPKHDRNRVRRRSRLRRKQLRQRRSRQHALRRVPILQDRAPLRRRQNLQPTNGYVGIANSRQQPQVSLLMVSKIGRGMKCRIGIEVDTKWTTICAVVNSDRQVLDRAK